MYLWIEVQQSNRNIYVNAAVRRWVRVFWTKSPIICDRYIGGDVKTLILHNKTIVILSCKGILIVGQKIKSWKCRSFGFEIFLELFLNAVEFLIIMYETMKHVWHLTGRYYIRDTMHSETRKKINETLQISINANDDIIRGMENKIYLRITSRQCRSTSKKRWNKKHGKLYSLDMEYAKIFRN